MKLVWKCWWCESLPGENCTVINLFTLFFRNHSYSCRDCPGTPRTSEILSFLKRLRLHSQFDWTLVCLNSSLLARKFWFVCGGVSTKRTKNKLSSAKKKKKRMSSPAASAGHRQKHNLNNSTCSMLPSITVDEQGFFSIISSDSLFITVAAPPLVRSGISNIELRGRVLTKLATSTWPKRDHGYFVLSVFNYIQGI